MATKRWLSIVVDGNSAMSPIWPKIVSEYLEKIVRFFFGNSREEGVNPSCEAGLIMYNTNSDIGLDVHFVNWTKDVDHFLGTLRNLTFNGNSAKQHTLVQGLAQASAMFPRTRMTAMEYFFECERNCILVATGVPVPQKMVVSLPLIREQNFVEGLHSLEADVLDVAEVFRMLRINLSIISTTNNPILTQIFNLGNPQTVKSPMIDCGNGELTVLLSRNFMEAHNVMRTTTDVTLPMNFTNNPQENPFSAGSSMAIGQQSTGVVQNILGHEYVNPIAPIIQQATDEINVPPPSFSQPMNLYDDIMAEPNNENDDIILPSEDDSWKDLLQLIDQPFTLDDPIAQNQTLPFATQVEGQELIQDMMRDIAPLNVTQEQTPTINRTPYIASTSIAGEGPSHGLAQQGNMGVMNPILSSENFPNANFSLPQNNPYLGPAGPSGMNNTSVGLGTVGVGSLDNATGNLINPLQPSSLPSLPVLPYSSTSSYRQHVPVYHRFEMTGISPVGAPATVVGANTWVHPEHNQTHLLRRPPSLSDFPEFVDAWQGYLVGRVHLHRESFFIAKALRNPTSPITLTADWSSRLEITIFIPKNAVNHTTRICTAPIDYMFVHIVQGDILDLYDHMMKKSLCAKIQLPLQTLILTTTESPQHFLGIVFPADTVFVEPV